MPQAMQPGSTVVQVGCGRSEVSVPLMAMVFKEIDLKTTFRYKQSWPKVIKLTYDGVFGDVGKMITHEFPIERTLEAFDACLDKSKLAIKVQVGLSIYQVIEVELTHIRSSMIEALDACAVHSSQQKYET